MSAPPLRPPAPPRSAPGERLRTAALAVQRALGLARPPAAASAHGLVGCPVLDASWRRAGTLHDLVIHPRTGRALGAVVAHSDPLGVDLLTVVPWGALHLGAACDRAVLLPHVTVASQPADALGGYDDDRYCRFVAAAAAALGRGGRRPGTLRAVGMGVAVIALLVVSPLAVLVGAIAVGGLLVRDLLEPPAAGPLAPLTDPPRPPVPRRRVVDVEYEVVGESVSAPWARESASHRGPTGRRIHLLHVGAGGAADGCRVGALGLGPLGGRVLGLWRGDCYFADPAPGDRLAGGDIVAVVLGPAGALPPCLRHLGLSAT